MDAEKQKAESGAEHQKKAKVFQSAELKVSTIIVPNIAVWAVK